MGEPALTTVCLPADGQYLDAVAARLLTAAQPPDLSRQLVLVSSLPLAAELRAALARQGQGTMLLPRFDTLRRWAMAAPLAGMPVPLPESERLVLLHEALRARGWFDERALWGVASELAALSDELSAAAVQLPDDETALVAQLESAYRLRASTPLAFEARVVHEMWRVLSACGRPDAPSVYRMRLAQLAEQATCPLTLVLDGPVDERLSPAEQAFAARYAAHQPVLICMPQRRCESDRPLARVLAAAWPEPASTDPLIHRAQSLSCVIPESPLAGRLQLFSVIGREAEAEAAAAQVGAWLAAGLRRIALVAEDRLTARRVRALLERQNVLVVDETGWKLSTTRAAATIDALLETVAGDAYHLDVLDLFKSPHLFSDVPLQQRAAAVLSLEQSIRKAGVRGGLPGLRHALGGQGGEQAVLAQSLLDRLEVAMRILGGKAASLSKWIARLLRALEALAAVAPLQSDAAGAEIMALLLQRQTELAGSVAEFAFPAWRDWLNRQLEGGAFRDRGISSPVVMLPRHDVRLRRFEAAIVIGADAAELTTQTAGTFFNQSVRRELGLPTREQAECALRRDLELLLCVVPRVAVTWQHEQQGEAQLLAPEFDLLATLHQLAWGSDLRDLPLRYLACDVPSEVPPATPATAAPMVPSMQLPMRVSVSGLSTLVACPYRFFARHVLHLNELDEIAETMEKQDYGLLVHRSLERFHAAYPKVSAMSETEAVAALAAIVVEVFEAAEADDWLAIGWRLRWESRLPAYLAWQRAREAAGWSWQSAETGVARRFQLPAGGELELYGRVDRIDAGPHGVALLDYKTKKRSDLRRQLPDDIQLPAYALLCGETMTAVEAAYVALDDETIADVPCADDLQGAAAAQEIRLLQTMSQMHAGTPLPANGVEAVCRYCEMAGLCRRDHVAH